METREHDEASAALRKADRRRKASANDERLITLSTGVKIRVQRVAPMLLTDIVSDLERSRPKPPVVFMQSLGREQENPDHPDYRQALDAWNATVASTINDAFVLFGTEIVEVPDGLPSKDDPRWLTAMRTLRRPVDDETERYLAWIKYVAAAEPGDVTAIISGVGAMSGVAEEDVSAAIRRFRDDQGRGANSRGPA